jgi:GTP-binding protein
LSERFNSDQLLKGRRLFSAPSTFMMGVAALHQLPPVKGVEIAFAGRSNVGKSSLINALTGVKELARASNTPGRTRELNFFNIADRLCQGAEKGSQEMAIHAARLPARQARLDAGFRAG